ncbi:MAG: FkbM family methyltransferase [Brevefilum sp.]
MRRWTAPGYYAYSILEMMIWYKNWPSLVPLFLRKPGTRIQKIKLRRPSIDLLVRGPMDVWSVKETFIDQFYTRYGAPVEDGWTVVDIGAGIGDYCLYAAEGLPGVTVYAFEPYPESFALLERNLALNGVENVHPFQKAVWSKEGELYLDLSTGEPLQISSQEGFAESTSMERLTVEAVSLQTLCSEEHLKSIDLLKMDCEGGEYEILFNTPEDVLERITRIIMEYHDLDEQKSHQRLAGFLENQGYKVTCHPNFVHQEIGYLYAER